MKQRSPVTAAVLSFLIPFYNIYWLYVTSKDIKAKGVKTPPLAMLFAPLLATLIVIIFGIATGMFAEPETTDSSSSLGAGLTILLLVIGLGAAVLSFIYYYKFCMAAETATSKQVSGGLTFILMLVLAPIAVYMIQEKLNETTAGGSIQPTAPNPLAGPPPTQPTAPPPQPPVVQ